MKNTPYGEMTKTGRQLPEKTQAEITAERASKGKTPEQMLEEARGRMVEKKMSKTPPMPLPDVGSTPPGVGMSDESKKMMTDTDAGYEFTKKREFAKGGSVSASKRADGCAVRGKTKGRML